MNTKQEKMVLSPRQKSLIIGTMLGDAVAEKQQGGNVRLRFDHALSQEEYALWKAKELKNLRTERFPVYKERVDKKTKKKSTHVCFDTRTLPCLIWCYDDFYRKVKEKAEKYVSPLIANQIDEFALSVLYMDDGHRRTDCNAARICTHCFDSESLEQLMGAIYRLTGAKTTTHLANAEKNQSVIYIPASECPKFFKVIRPHVAQVPSMLRKIIDYPV
uniref:hypothetical protein n=1 Tax=Gormaniella terricola TaxID=2904618 RepID=UPI0021CCE199|nr:hypothetical protein [Gormaniella terricola]UWV18225.1 hypothetical protein [Gormaniella terricola]